MRRNEELEEKITEQDEEEQPDQERRTKTGKTIFFPSSVFSLLP